jgi:hypothetical protein
MESRETELCNKLYKTEEEQQIFLVSNFETRTEGNNKQSKIFLDFSNTKPKMRKKKQTKARKLKRQTKRNNGNIFGLFVFLKEEIRTRSTKKKSETWIYKVPTNYYV